MTEQQKPPGITKTGKAEAVIQDVTSCDETLALLKILALGNREIEEGRVKPLAVVARRLRGA